MYILLDHIGDTIYPLGEKPLEACLKFCDYTKRCLPNDGLYPPGCARHAFDAFRTYVRSGTYGDLHNLVYITSQRLKKGTRYPYIFELRVLPCPTCRDCRHWKNDGVYCEGGQREQSSKSERCLASFLSEGRQESHPETESPEPP